MAPLLAPLALAALLGLAATEPAVQSTPAPAADPAPVAGPAPAADVPATAPSDAKPEDEFPPHPPPPSWLSNKSRLTVEDYKKKQEHGYFTGLPLLNYDSNTGVGFGARLYYYWDADRTDPLFAYTPYRHRVFLQAFGSTGAFQYHWLNYDVPYLFDTPYRLRANLQYERVGSANYFGFGSRSMQSLSFPGSSTSYSSFSDYSKALQAIQPNGTLNTLYNKFDFQRPWLELSLEREFLGGLLRPFVGLGFSYGIIQDFSGRSTTGVDATGGSVSAPNGNTKLHDDCAAGLLVGCQGGWDNYLRFAIAYDSRDFEPDPNSGIFSDLAVDIGTIALGSQYNYIRALFAFRGYYSPIPKIADLVLAGRFVFQVQTPGAPFFTSDNLIFPEDTRFGLGGGRTLRGFAQDRFVGPVVLLANAELRWTFFHFDLLWQKFALIGVPFLDLGAVYDRVTDVQLTALKRSQGLALRLAWNQATIIMVDYGFGGEDTGLYINFNHIF